MPLIMGQTILKSMAAQDIRQYDTVHYNCPTSIDLYIGGVKDRTIPKNGNVVKTLSTGAGYFYTDVNGGSPTAEGPICAGFFNDILNTGLEVQPKGHIADWRRGRSPALPVSICKRPFPYHACSQVDKAKCSQSSRCRKN